jgi:hydroxyacylglutathione hydrolase
MIFTYIKVSEPMPNITPIAALTDNYIWLLSDPMNHYATAIDPGEAAPLLAYLSNRNIELTDLLITHHHPDHVAGIPQLLKHFPRLRIYGPEHESLPFLTHPVQAAHKVTLANLGWQFTVMAVPGHTLEHIAYYTPGHLFCGDSLFAAGCGRLFEGTPAQMWHSLTQLSALPAATQVYAGHEYTLANLRFALTIEPENQALNARWQQCQQLRRQQQPTLPSTLEQELASNPFLRCQNHALLQAIGQKNPGIELSDPIAVFAYLRQLKDCF